MILIGAHVFIPFLALSEIPTRLAGFLTSLNAGPTGILAIFPQLALFLPERMF